MAYRKLKLKLRPAKAGSTTKVTRKHLRKQQQRVYACAAVHNGRQYACHACSCSAAVDVALLKYLTVHAGLG
jgi:hypothetical protein